MRWSYKKVVPANKKWEIHRFLAKFHIVRLLRFLRLFDEQKTSKALSKHFLFFFRADEETTNVRLDCVAGVWNTKYFCLVTSSRIYYRESTSKCTLIIEYRVNARARSIFLKVVSFFRFAELTDKEVRFLFSLRGFGPVYDVLLKYFWCFRYLQIANCVGMTLTCSLLFRWLTDREVLGTRIVSMPRDNL